MKPIVLHFTGALALTFTVAACVPSPDSTPAPATGATPTPRPAPPPPPPPPPPVYSSWMDVPKSPGDWSYTPVAGGSRALFGESVSEARFALGCSASSRQVTLTRFDAATGSLIIRTESASRALPAQPSNDGTSARAAIAGGDPLLDAMALTKGRFAVEAAGLPTLYLPAWAEVTRVIEDCR